MDINYDQYPKHAERTSREVGEFKKLAGWKPSHPDWRSKEKAMFDMNYKFDPDDWQAQRRHKELLKIAEQERFGAEALLSLKAMRMQKSTLPSRREKNTFKERLLRFLAFGE